jgi:hypothetical protein
MLRLRSRLFPAPAKRFLQHAKHLAPSLPEDELSAVALALQAKEKQKERLMQQFAPMYNRRALEALVRHLRNSKGFQHVVELKDLEDGVNMTGTAKKVGEYLETKGCTNREARALRKIFKDWSGELNSMPIPLSIESAGWAGLQPDQTALMRTVYNWLKRNNCEQLPCKKSNDLLPREF